MYSCVHGTIIVYLLKKSSDLYNCVIYTVYHKKLNKNHYWVTTSKGQEPVNGKGPVILGFH